MSSLMEYSGIQVVTPDPSGFGGLAVNNNFKALSTAVQAADPTAGDDSTAGFSTGSWWYNSGIGNELAVNSKGMLRRIDMGCN